MISAGAIVAAQAAAINAIRSFGVIVTVEPDEFLKVVSREQNPLVVTAQGGIFSTEYRYLVSHRGLAFFAKSSYPLQLPSNVDVIVSSQIAMPG